MNLSSFLAEQYDLTTGETLGFTINDPIELYTKIASKFQKETKEIQTTALGNVKPRNTMQKQLVSYWFHFLFQKLKNELRKEKYLLGG